MIKFLIRIIRDLWRTFIPSDSRKEGFAFIVHPRGYGDIVSNLPFLKIFPKSFVLKYFHFIWPFTVSKIIGLKSLLDGKELTGWVIGVPIFDHQMIENRPMAQRKIKKAINLAKNKGAYVIGLGAMTGSVMEGGAGMSRRDGTIITAGRAYTAYTVKSYADDVVLKFNLNKSDLVVAVVGAAGGVGMAVTRLLVNDGYKKLLLIDLERKLEHLRAGLSIVDSLDIEVTHQIKAVKEADIIIT